MEALSTGYGLVAGPTYDPRHGIVFSDVLNGGVHALNPSTGAAETLIPHRRGIGGMAPRIGGTFVVSGSVRAGRDNAGTFYRGRADVPGVPIHPARMPLSRVRNCHKNIVNRTIFG